MSTARAIGAIIIGAIISGMFSIIAAFIILKRPSSTDSTDENPSSIYNFIALIGLCMLLFCVALGFIAAIYGHFGLGLFAGGWGVVSLTLLVIGKSGKEVPK